MNDELNQFSQEIITETHLKRDVFPDLDMAFTAAILEKISDLLDCTEPILKHCRLTTRNGNVTGEIHGYAESVNEEVLYLFYSDFNPNSEIKNKNNTEGQVSIVRPQGFYNAAIRGIHTDYDMASNEYDALKYIYDNNQKFNTVKIVVLTNYNYNDLTIKNLRIPNKPVYLDLWDIKKLFSVSHSLSDHVPIDIDFNDEDYKNFRIPYLQMESSKYGYKCIQAMFPAKLLYILYEKYNTNLLYSNIRLFLGLKGNKDKPNVAMLNTLRTQNEMFLAYNNGITALAQGIEFDQIGEKTDISDQSEDSTYQEYITMGILKKILDFRIINGGQTTATIFNARQLGKKEHDPSKKVNLRGVFVQIKIIISDSIAEISHNITTSSNLQNKVKISDFSVSNPFNKRLETLSYSIQTPPSESHSSYHWFFERLRGQYDELKKTKRTKQEKDMFEFQFPHNKKFTKEEVAKVWNSWNGRPDDAVKGASTTYSSFMKLHEDDVPDEIFYKKSIALIIVLRFLLARPESRTYGNGKATVAAYAIAMLNLNTLGQLNLMKIWDNQELSDNMKIYLNKLSDEIFETLRSNAEALGTTVLSYGKTKATLSVLQRKNLNVDYHLLDEDIS